MDVHIRLGRRGDLSVQIYRQLLAAILDGRLPSGERLPATRELARRLAVSRNTVGVAYEQLVADGVLIGRVGDGSFVSSIPNREIQRRQAPAGAILPRDVWDSLSPIERSPQALTYDFTVGVPDHRLFPYTTWRRLLANELRSPDVQYARYGSPGGHAPLRAAIARHIG